MRVEDDLEDLIQHMEDLIPNQKIDNDNKQDNEDEINQNNQDTYDYKTYDDN